MPIVDYIKAICPIFVTSCHRKGWRRLFTAESFDRLPLPAYPRLRARPRCVRTFGVLPSLKAAKKGNQSRQTVSTLFVFASDSGVGGRITPADQGCDVVSLGGPNCRE